MPDSQEEFNAIVQNPRESLDTELKCWIDPSTDNGIVKIAKACLALFNNNGGRLIIGIHDDGQPDGENVPVDVRAAFHADVVQAIVTRLASRPFEVTVEFGQRGGQEFPMIVVPPGVVIPVAAKRDLTAPDGTNLKVDTVYVRTVNSSNTVSSAPARAADLERLMKICFDNRDADLGGFVRRQLGSMDLEGLGFFSQSSSGRDPTPNEQAKSFLDVGQEHFQQALERFAQAVPEEMGIRESAIVIAGDVPSYVLNDKFLWQLESRKPNHTGWTPWILTEGRLDDPTNAHIFDNGYERLMLDLHGQLGFTFGDFWRIEPGGRFYHLRINEDDTPGSMGQRKPEPGTQLDFLLQISRTAEIISIGLAFARALGCKEEETSLAFAFRWNGLARRQLTSWVDPGRFFRGRGVSHQNSITTGAIVPLETPQSAIAPHVEKLVAPLFALFGGMTFEPSVIEGIVSKTLGNRY